MQIHIPSHLTDVMHQKYKLIFFNTKIQSQFPKFKVKKKKLYAGPFLSPQNFNSTSFKSYLYKALSAGANRSTCEWLWYFSRELNTFLEILSSAEYSKLLVSRNSERETEFMEKFTIEILVRFSACGKLRRHICRSRVWVHSILLALNLGLQTKRTPHCTTTR